MKPTKLLYFFLLVIVSVVNQDILWSQNAQNKPSRQSSFEAFSKGDYEKAYKEFSDLLLIYTKDPLYKYYSGVCLVKLQRDPAKAVNLIQQSLQGSSAVKVISSDAWFYLGRAQQMAGRFPEAIEAYNLYTEQTGKKVSREMGVPQYLQECNEKKGMLAVTEVIPEEVPVSEKNDKIEKSEKSEVLAPQTIPVVTAAAIPVAEKKVTPKQNISSEYELILAEALGYQVKSDSLNALATSQKSELAKLSGNDRQVMAAKISEIEILAASYQKKADQKYNEARIAMNTQQAKAETVTVVSNTGNTKANQPPNQGSSPKEVAPADSKTAAFSYFEVLPKPVTDPNAKIIIDPEIPDGLIYRIQMGVFRNPVAPAFFKGLTPIYGFKVAGTDKTYYYAGMFRRSEDARNALTAVKGKGFKDSFVVPLSEGKSITADRAALLEKEWGAKPFYSTGSLTKPDTVPPTLRYRVEVVRSLKPLKEDAVESIRKVAGSRGLDIQLLDDGKSAYLIGKFITFESAIEYADLLIRNGYPDTKVVAWLGEKEIPVETARQLFDDAK